MVNIYISPLSSLQSDSQVLDLLAGLHRHLSSLVTAVGERPWKHPKVSVILVWNLIGRDAFEYVNEGKNSTDMQTSLRVFVAFSSLLCPVALCALLENKRSSKRGFFLKG